MKTISVLLLLLFVLNPAEAQNEKSLFWHVSGNGLQKPSFIYGTIHLTCPGDVVITDTIKKAFVASEQVYLEIDMDDPDLLKKMQPKLMLPQGQHIKDFMAEEDYKTIDAHLTSKMGVGLSQVGIMKPFAIFSMIMATTLPCMSQGYETAFVNLAKEQKKEMFGLETMDFQLSIFDKIPNKEFLHMVADMIRRKSDIDKEFYQLMDLYKKQDIDSLLTFMNSSEWNFKGFEEEFIYKRNANWASLIPKLAAEKSSFFAVGAGHLGGEKGILQLLRNAGYTVNAVK